MVTSDELARPQPHHPPFTIEYGTDGHWFEVTKRAYRHFYQGGFIVIPKDNATMDRFFGDPIYGRHKHIRVHTSWEGIQVFNGKQTVVDVRHIDSNLFHSKNTERDWFHKEFCFAPHQNLANIHENIQFEGGSQYDEYPEQLMIMNYVKPNNKVLEIGSNIGRATLIIATILGKNQSDSFVTMECDPGTCNQLHANLVLNNYQVHIEASALSNRKLMQKGWDTIPFEGEYKPGYSLVKTITFSELMEKYRIDFDTLVADCEGALFYILSDDPNMLNGFRTIIMENDYHVLEQKEFVDEIMKSKGFNRVYVKEGGWGPCEKFFFEVWQKF
eukprot:TRINITY_DN4634_c0_g3_i1.p2 TRINITY_DN4634_c0_g3~~TRINITY_DN4634_c0_g3_i1.p2  ORF type:complete len:329 (+),score=88.54 TRINITY_DN4634_c0_g3_i1:127-1113(+)